jgi:hypothetical protein
MSVSALAQNQSAGGNMTGQQMQPGMANDTQGAEKTANQTEAASNNTAQGVQAAINDTGQFIGNVSETIAKNPVVANASKETQEFFSEGSK